MAAAVKSSAGMAGTRSRKPYVITRPRERWTADEHRRFLHALLLFGRDWKGVQAFVATKTATQIRSHAQKHFLRAQKKLGLAAPTPQRPRSSTGAGAGAGPGHWQQRLRGCTAGWAWCADDGASVPGVDETVWLPLSPDDPHFAQVYRFVGDVFGSRASRPVEAQLHRLLGGADPVVVDTVLRVLANLQDNFSLYLVGVGL